MGEISTGSSSEIERLKQILMDEFKIHQRMIRSTAVEYQTLLKKTAVRLTSGLDSMYKEKFQYLDEIAAKLATGDGTEDFFSKEFCGTVFATFDLDTAQLQNAIESWNVSSSNGHADLHFSMSTPSFETDAEVKVDVSSGITKQGIFWLHLQELPESNLLALADLHKQISMKLLREKEWKSFKDSETSPDVGDYILVDTWNGWMRGKIEKVKDDNTYAVRLVDYGDLTSYGPEVLLPMKSEIYPDGDYQALRCCLSLDGDPFEIPIEAVWAFNDLLQENLAVRNPVSCVFKERILSRENEVICRVDLIVKDKKQNFVSVSEALNKKIEDKARGRDSIACRDIRYSGKDCAVARYVERPADGSIQKSSTPDSTENAAAVIENNAAVMENTAAVMENNAAVIEDAAATIDDIAAIFEDAAEVVDPGPAVEQRDTRSCGVGLPALMLAEQLAAEKQEVVPHEYLAVDRSIWAAKENPATESLYRVSPRDLQPERRPELFAPLFEQQSVQRVSAFPSAFPLDLQNLLQSAPPPFASSENLTATLEKPSVLKADAAPFVSRSQTKLDLPAKPVSVSTDGGSARYLNDGYCEFVAQEESVMEMHQYFGPPVNLPVRYPTYAAGVNPMEFDRNVSPVMPGMIYAQGPAFSYMPQVLNTSCVPTYPVHREPGCYGHQETVHSDAPSLERNAEGPKQVEHLLSAVCSTIGSQFAGEVTSQLEPDGSVWMQPARNDQQMADWNRTQETLHTCNKLTLPLDSENVVPGLYVTVPSSKSAEVFRAEVLSVKDRKAVLRCIDYGRTIVAPRDSLKPLVDKARSLPRQAVLCRLSDEGSSVDQYFDQNQCKLFDSHVKGRTMTANVMSIEPGNPDILAIKIRDTVGRDVIDELMPGHFNQRLQPSYQDDSGIRVMQRSPDAFSVSSSISNTRVQQQSPPQPVIYPPRLSQLSSSACCVPVQQLMASVQGASLQGINLQGASLQGTNLQGASLQRAPPSLADVAPASLPALSSLAYNLNMPPPSLQSTPAFSTMVEANNATGRTPPQNFSSPPETQNEWNNSGGDRMEKQANHPRMESSEEMPPKDRQKRGSRQQRFRDNERSTPTPPLGAVHNDGYSSGKQQVADDDRHNKYGRKNVREREREREVCFGCGGTGHWRSECPHLGQPQNKGQSRGGYGRTNSRK